MDPIRLVMTTNAHAQGYRIQTYPVPRRHRVHEGCHSDGTGPRSQTNSSASSQGSGVPVPVPGPQLSAAWLRRGPCETGAVRLETRVRKGAAAVASSPQPAHSAIHSVAHSAAGCSAGAVIEAARPRSDAT
ncbi:hypothetical protein CFAM422_009982 [Trichoderma lentiforme]|uniref:Uncharacterized protein n=1 Tax=Trichoderma lentiforme TaxID=1567552 RepID=A0A9P4X8N3_9HYPO|nr:hypothetical protein CFAM422_009982 [Trichoderma lentiforme]